MFVRATFAIFFALTSTKLTSADNRELTFCLKNLGECKADCLDYVKDEKPPTAAECDSALEDCQNTCNGPSPLPVTNQEPPTASTSITSTSMTSMTSTQTCDERLQDSLENLRLARERIRSLEDQKRQQDTQIRWLEDERANQTIRYNSLKISNSQEKRESRRLRTDLRATEQKTEDSQAQVSTLTSQLDACEASLFNAPELKHLGVFCGVAARVAVALEDEPIEGAFSERSMDRIKNITYEQGPDFNTWFWGRLGIECPSGKPLNRSWPALGGCLTSFTEIIYVLASSFLINLVVAYWLIRRSIRKWLQKRRRNDRINRTISVPAHSWDDLTTPAPRPRNSLPPLMQARMTAHGYAMDSLGRARKLGRSLKKSNLSTSRHRSLASRELPPLPLHSTEVRPARPSRPLSSKPPTLTDGRISPIYANVEEGTRLGARKKTNYGNPSQSGPPSPYDVGPASPHTEGSSLRPEASNLQPEAENEVSEETRV